MHLEHLICSWHVYHITKHLTYFNIFVQIYVPMCDKNHWYLMVVSFMDRSVFWFDSYPRPSEMESRLSSMRFVVTPPFIHFSLHSSSWSSTKVFELAFRHICPFCGVVNTVHCWQQQFLNNSMLEIEAGNDWSSDWPDISKWPLLSASGVPNCGDRLDNNC